MYLHNDRRTPRVSRGEMIRVIREFTIDKNARSGLGFYYWAPVEYECTCSRSGGKADIDNENLDNDMITAELEPVEFNVHVTDLGETLKLTIEQTKRGLWIGEEDGRVFEAILEPEVEIEKDPNWENGGKLSFNVTVTLEELASGLGYLSDDQLQAIFKEVTSLRPELLDDLSTALD